MTNVAVYNATNVYCIGHMSCQSSVFAGITSIRADGNSSLTSASIYSQSPTGVFTAILDGYNSNMFDIYCSPGDVCYVVCQTSPHGCDGLRFYCNESSGSFCGFGNFTRYPTSYPTSSPTIPTDIPTSIPTYNPATNGHSLMPSSMPSSQPVDIYTTEIRISISIHDINQTDDTQTDQSNNNNHKKKVIAKCLIITFALYLFTK